MHASSWKAMPLLLLLVACGVREAEEARPLRAGLLGAPSGLDPHLQNDFVTHSVLFNLFEGLTAFDPKMELRPALAERWEGPDDLTWRFILRRGALFHDGREVSAADVVFSLERARRARESGAADYLTAIRSVRQLDYRTVELTTVRPYALLPHKLTTVAIVPADSPERIEQPIGSGPYELVSASSAGLRLRAFPRYWRGVAAVREVELEVVPSPEERLARVRAGTLDLALNLQPAQAQT